MGRYRARQDVTDTGDGITFPSGHIRLQLKGVAAWLLLDRAERGNAWLTQMWDEAVDALRRADGEESIRVILIASAGGSVFSGGADLDELAELTAGSEAEARASHLLAEVERFVGEIETTSKPVVAVIDGAAMGAGLEIAAACDLRLASTRARFGIPAARHGLVINRLDIARLIRVVGWPLASEMLLTARTLDGEEALRSGLVSAAVPEDELDEVVERTIQLIASLSADSIAAMKRHLHAAWPAGDAADDDAFADSRAGLLSEGLQSSLAERRSKTLERRTQDE